MTPRPEQRAAARLAAVQALYQMELAGTALPNILAEFESHWIGQEVEGDQYKPADIGLFRDVLNGVLEHQGPLDRMVNDALQSGWPLTRVESILRAILRAGAYELRHRGDVPARVVIKEYADIGGAFFEREEVGMINAVLDGLAHRLRAEEFDAKAH
ncbi:transcription antitermination factor NusB [Lichenihabitans sp. Uapishka_5]|uniref:transcription antitermination factor NusB n=1 Tax=Lichenihabitans sp. Uapishka_5 TaxID=3037302 RepID=UPI0029E8190F|nr:transcription antitermination factor NusB [Lichenihabitans sp. Uapishka_5]MDX7950919.1 transcription antitermination factor NusB [Lichenihabitans sp. Uapishka_5]